MMRSKLYALVIVMLCASFAKADYSGYTYRQEIDVSSANVSQVNHSTFTNFPMLISVNDVKLSTTTGSGGHLANANGYDLIVSTNADCSWKVAFDTETMMNVGVSTYNVLALMTLSTTTTTTAYLCYGNSLITTFQGNPAAVYDPFYMLVAHMANGTTLSVADATGNQTLTNNSNTAGDGKIDGAAFNTGGNNRDIRITSPNGLYNMPATTYSAWVFISSIYNPDNDSSMSIMDFATRTFSVNKSSTVTATIFTNGSFRTTTTSTLLSTGTWTKLDATWDSAGDLKWRIYINGTEASYSGQSAGTGTTSSDTGNFSIGSSASNGFFGNFDGAFDEVRVSSTSRTADWINTEYLNQSNPSTFYTRGPETTTSTGPSNILFFGSPI